MSLDGSGLQSIRRRRTKERPRSLCHAKAGRLEIYTGVLSSFSKYKAPSRWQAVAGFRRGEHRTWWHTRVQARIKCSSFARHLGGVGTAGPIKGVYLSTCQAPSKLWHTVKMTPNFLVCVLLRILCETLSRNDHT